MFALSPRHLGKRGYSVLEVADTVRRWETTYATIEFSWIDEIRAPLDDMFEDALVQLMEHVRGDARVNIGVGKVSPERVNRVARYVEFLARLQECMGVAIALGLLVCAPENVQCPDFGAR